MHDLVPHGRFRPEPVQVGAVRFSSVSEDGAIRYVLDSLAQRRGGWVCPVNTDVLRQCTQSSDLLELVHSADLVLADGAPIVLASRGACRPLPGRVAGSTLLWTLCRDAARHGRSVFLLGGAPGAADGAARNLASRNPGLNVAGVYCPPLGFELDARERERVSDALLKARPDIVFVGLGFPKQDRYIASVRQLLPGTWFVSCGISFSFAAGSIRRAPRWLQRAGLEWVHRLIQEPRRLFGRYIIKGIPFTLSLLLNMARRRLACGR